MARMEPVLVSTPARRRISTVSLRKCRETKLLPTARAEGDCSEAKITLPGVNNLDLKLEDASMGGVRQEQQQQQAGVKVRHPPSPPLIPRHPSLSSPSSSSAAVAGGKKIGSSSLPVLPVAGKPVGTPPRVASAVEAARSSDVGPRPPPRLVKSVQPAARSSDRPCSCLCHVTALHHTTPPTTATLTSNEAGTKMATADAAAGAVGSETQDKGQGQLCWQCKMRQCYSCGLDLPDHTTHREPVCRSGRMGAPWRHVRGVTTNSGVYYSFLDGAVKSDDARYYPPYGYIPGRQVHQVRRPVCLCGGCKSCVCAKRVLTATSYYDHAKTGFRYWFDDLRPKPKCKNVFKSMGAMAIGYKLGY